MEIDLVSIICPTYNSELYIGIMIESIIKQTYKNWELLITDDCSTDSTWTIINNYVLIDDRIKVFALNKNSGPGIARNNSIKEAVGRYIAFCDSDDQWFSNKLEKQVYFMKEKACALSYSSYKIIDELGNIKGQIIAKPEIDYYTMLKNNYIGCLTAMYDITHVGKVYMPKIRKRQDWALWLAILKKTDYGYGISESLALYRLHNNSISTKKIELLKYNYAIFKEVENFSTVKSMSRIIIFLFYYFKTKLSQK